MTTTLFESSLHSLPLLHRGKVRDNYAVGDDRILMIATDRISAFDVVMGEPIPGKGEILTKMALFWFKKLEHILPNHLTGEDPESVVAPDEVDQVRGRAMLVKRLKPIPIEAVVRGYLAGSGWREYQSSGTVCGVPLPPGLQQGSRLPSPIFTPATKAEAGAHDENIDFPTMEIMVGPDLAQRVRTAALSLYSAAAEYALTRNIVIADTKFEFGLTEAGVLTVMDEMLTPDSSRFWIMISDSTGGPLYLDKQVLREWLNDCSSPDKQWNRSGPAPTLTDALIETLTLRYSLAVEKLT
jgi:phosphoribosylaminoimidazole-succinocarboxamide synthase